MIDSQALDVNTIADGLVAVDRCSGFKSSIGQGFEMNLEIVDCVLRSASRVVSLQSPPSVGAGSKELVVEVSS